MTTRDRLFGLGVAAAAILAAMWFLLVSPERGQISGLNAQVSSAQQALSAAQGKLSTARTSQASYQTDYASIVKLGEAVPPTAQVPSLVYELDQLSKSKDVDFASIASSASASSSAASASPTASTGFSELPFTFTFNGSFFDLYKLLNKLDGLAVQTTKGGVQITGRLLTIQSADLTAGASSAAPSTAKSTNSSTKTAGEGQLMGTITATAYVLPAAQGLTAGATPAGPAGAASATTPQAVSTPAPPSSPTPAAAIKVTP